MQELIGLFIAVVFIGVAIWFIRKRKAEKVDAPPTSGGGGGSRGGGGKHTMEK